MQRDGLERQSTSELGAFAAPSLLTLGLEREDAPAAAGGGGHATVLLGQLLIENDLEIITARFAGEHERSQSPWKMLATTM